MKSPVALRIALVVLLAGLVPSCLSLGAPLLLGQQPGVLEPLHNFLESAGSCIALAVALLLLLRAGHEPQTSHLLWLAAGLTAMGLLDAAHALVPFGVAWSWLRHGATLAGGLFFGLVWMPLPGFAARRKGACLLAVGVLTTAGAALLWTGQSWLPAPWRGTDYTFLVKAANALGGLGFLAAALFFLRRYAAQPQAAHLLFASFSLLFSAAALLFGFSHLWAPDWWLWHVFRLLAYGLVFLSAFASVRLLYRALTLQAGQLEDQVRARTAELHQATERFRQGEQKLRAMFEHSNAGLVLFDAQPPYRILAVNRFYEQLWPEPWPSRGLLGLALSDFAPGLQEAGVTEIFRQVVQTRKGRFIPNTPYDHMVGGRRWWNWTLEPVLQDGQVVALAHLAVEVTPEVKARELLQAVLDHIPVLLCIWDPQLKRFQFNKHLRDVLGWTEADTLQGDFLAKVYPDPLYRQKVIAYMQSLAPGWRDLQTTAKDGTLIDCSWANLALPDGRTIGIAVDIRERKRTEAALRQSEAMLRTILEHLPSGVTVRDARTGALLLANARSHQILGTVAPGLQQFDGYRGLHPDGRPYAHQDWPLARSVATGEIVQAEEILCQRPDGSRQVLSINSAPVRDARGAITLAVSAFDDITERKRAEEALRQSEERYRLVAETMLQGVVHQDINGTIIAMNAAAETILGKTHDEFLGSSSIREEHHTIREDGSPFPGVEHPAMVALRTGQPVRGVVMGVFNPRLDQRRWISIDAVPVFRSGQATPVEVYTVFADITERKQVEQNLLRSSQHQELLARTASSLLLTGDPQTVVDSLCNEVRLFLDCAVFFNYLLDPATRRLRFNACGGVDPRFARKVEDLELAGSLCGTAAQGACRVLEEHLSASADPRSELVRHLGIRAYACHPLLGPGNLVLGTLSFGASNRDVFSPEDLALMKTVTDHVAVAMLRRRSEEALRQAVARYEQQVRLFEGVASTTPDFVYLFDRQGRFLYANRRLLEVWGMQLPDILGKTCRELGYAQWHHDLHMREIAQVIQTRQPIKGEVPFKAPQTGIFGVYEYIFTPVLGPDGQVETIAGTTRDITERQQFQARLEHQVAERTAKLQEMLAELQHISYAIVHDMRAPLRAMNGFAEMLEEECASSLQPCHQDYLARIRAATRRLDLQITDALNYTKAVQQEPPLLPVDLARLLPELIQTYPNLHQAEITLDGTLPTVLGNESLLTQCFSNLLGNAVKFVQPGQKPRIRIWAENVASGKLMVDSPAPSRSQPSTLNPQPASAHASPNPEDAPPRPPRPSDGRGAGGEGSGSINHQPSTINPSRGEGPSQPSTTPSLHHSMVRIYVQDNGIGIPQHAHGRLFQMFQRMTTTYEGTGIGLAIVRKVVERMGGRVGVQSQPGQGSRFWVELQPAP